MAARKTKWIVGGAIALAVIAGGTGIAIATGANDGDTPLTGPALEHATAAALERTGGGTVIDSEAGDGGAAYSVEVRLEDGSVVEVSLDEHFDVIGQESDEDVPNETETGSD